MSQILNDNEAQSSMPSTKQLAKPAPTKNIHPRTTPRELNETSRQTNAIARDDDVGHVVISNPSPPPPTRLFESEYVGLQNTVSNQIGSTGESTLHELESMLESCMHRKIRNGFNIESDGL